MTCTATPPRSDGNDTPKEFLDTAAELGMKVVAITDHDVLPPEKIEVGGLMVECGALCPEEMA